MSIQSVKGYVLAALSLCLAACGQQSTVAPEPSSALQVDVHEGEFARIQQFVTPKGVSVWLVEEPSIPILSLRLAWKAGAANDPEGLEGLTNAMIYHMNEGAGTLDAQAFFKRMEELNMSFGCGSGAESTYCNASMLIDAVDESFEMIGLALSEPRFDDGPFERYLREQEVALRTRETNPSYLAAQARNAVLYPDHPYARTVSAESLAALTQVDMAKQKNRLMTRDRLLVTAVGAISPEQLAPLIDAAVADLPATSDVVTTPPVVLADAVTDPVVVNLPQPQSLVSFTAPAMRRDNPDFYTAVVLNYIFGGGGFESRLMKDLRVDKGLTYGVYSQLSPGEKLQTWSGGGQTKNESAAAFIAGIKDNMSKLVDDGITAEELADAKSYLTGSYPLGFDSNAKIAARMMSVRIEELPVSFFDTRNAQIEAVTLEAVNRVAASYLQPERFTFIVVGEPQLAQDDTLSE